MCIRVKLDVRKPLKRKKKILKKNGEEVMVSCKYERLGEFCFTCGMLTHTERYCRKFLNEGSSKDWGSWLKAPSRRAGSQAKSRWLREEDDKDWEARQEWYGSCPKLGGSSYGKKDNIMSLGNAIVQDMQNKGDNAHPLISAVKQIDGRRENSNLSNDNGLEQEEMSGLPVSDRKGMRGGPNDYDTMDTPGGLVNV